MYLMEQEELQVYKCLPQGGGRGKEIELCNDFYLILKYINIKI